MSNMRKLLESIDKFSGEPKQKPGDQVRGHEKAKSSNSKKHPFAGRLVGANESKEDHDDDLVQSLMLEYKMFEVGNLAQNQTNSDQPNSPVAQINPPGMGTANTNPALQAQDDQKSSLASKANDQPGQPQQNQQQPATSQQAAQKMKQSADLTKNITGLKSLDPTLNIQKTVDAIEKDPQHVTAADAEALAHVVNAIEPMLKNNQAAAGLTSNLKRMMTKGPQ
jgi:hypothetical protein